ncbi:MAG: hypothetical protein PHE15_04600, partial [Dehalococcoidales bacterium]|nr:hypothetical protein [Dehalococcoidales bacterium]
VCEYGKDRCLGDKEKCANYFFVDPRRWDKKGVGPSTTNQRTLCNLLYDLNEQIKERSGTVTGTVKGS